jgi:hypothetical protein
MVYGLLRALPGDRLVDTVTGEMNSASLTPAPRRQDHTSSPSALATPVSRAAASTASPPRVRDVRVTPLRVGRDGERYSADLGLRKTRIFFQKGLDTSRTRSSRDLPVGQAAPRDRGADSLPRGQIRTTLPADFGFELIEHSIDDPAKGGRIFWLARAVHDGKIAKTQIRTSPGPYPDSP